MKKGLVVISAMAVALSLSACSKSDDNKGGGKGSVPSDIAQQEIVQGKPITADDKAVLQKIFKGAEIVPASSFFLRGDESPEDKEKIERQAGELKDRKKQLHTEILNNCNISGKSAQSKQDDIKTGNTIAQSSNISISGNNCPLAADDSENGELFVNFSNIDELKKKYEETGDASVMDLFILNMSINMNVKMNRVHSAELVKETGLRSQSISAVVQGTIDAKKELTKMHMKIQGGGKVVLEDNSEAHLKLAAESLASAESSKSFLRIDIAAKGTNVVVQLITSGDKAKYYVNGHEMSEPVFRDIFGDMNDMVSAQGSPIK